MEYQILHKDRHAGARRKPLDGVEGQSKRIVLVDAILHLRPAGGAPMEGQ